jgi:hypothetical protein
MGYAGDGAGWVRGIVVRRPEGPVEGVVEADAVDAAVGLTEIVVRGPLYGVAAQREGDGARWRVVVGATHGRPQEARDALNSYLWFRAKDEAGSTGERRELLAAVARLETERVDELSAFGTRYRVIRVEEYAGVGPDGIEQPRPTDLDADPEPPADGGRPQEPEIDAGLLLDPAAPMTPTQAAERLMMTGLTYGGTTYSARMREEARLALETHPDVVLLPATFRGVERTGRDAGWRTSSALHATAQGARGTLDFTLTWYEPRRRRIIPWSALTKTDVRAMLAEPDGGGLTGRARRELAELVAASDRLAAGRLTEVETLGTTYRIARARRLVRWGLDGPEGPRPADPDGQAPSQMHPVMDEDGTIHFEEVDEDDAEFTAGA